MSLPFVDKHAALFIVLKRVQRFVNGSDNLQVPSSLRSNSEARQGWFLIDIASRLKECLFTTFPPLDKLLC